SERVAFLAAQAGGAFDEVDLLVFIAVFELVVVGVVEGFRKGIADVVEIGDTAYFRLLVRGADEQTVVPALCGGVDDGHAIGDVRDGIGDLAGNVGAGAGDVGRGRIGIAQKASDELTLSEDV